MPTEFVVTAPRTIEYRDYSEPPLRAEEVRVRSMVSGIKTGTEMTLYRGSTPFLGNRFDVEYRLFLPVKGNGLYPCNLGSWMVGEVTEKGSTVKGLQIGDLVHGRMEHRPTNVRPEKELHIVPKGIGIETEVFVDPAIFALQAVHD